MRMKKKYKLVSLMDMDENIKNVRIWNPSIYKAVVYNDEGRFTPGMLV